MQEDLIARFIGIDLLSNVANDIGFGIERLANRINSLASTSSAQMKALAVAHNAASDQMIENDVARATSSYMASQAVVRATANAEAAAATIRSGGTDVMEREALKQAIVNKERIADENAYTGAMERNAMARIATAEREEAAQIASRQRIMAAFTTAGTMMVMSGVAMIGTAAALGAGLAFAADHAAKFEQQLLLVQTQAGGTHAEVDLLRKATMQLGPEFGYTATTAATAAYHIESVGLRGARAVDALKYSMMGARIAGSDLEETANMLSTIMASTLVPATESSEHTMATLDAIIGQGNVRMDQLAASFRTGLIGAMQMAGVGLTSAGAAIATLTDLGYTGATAGTALRSALTMIAAPSNKATELLKDMGFSVEEVTSGMSKMRKALLDSGINVTEFAKIVREQGIAGGLQALHDAMVKGGLSADEMAATITKAFGGSRIGSAFKVLMENLDRLHMRERMIAENSTAAIFEQKWKVTSELTTTKMGQLKAGFDNIIIVLGEALIPSVNRAIDAVSGFLNKVFAWVSANQALIAQFAPVIVAALAIAGAFLLVAGVVTVLGAMVAALVAGFTTFAGPVLIVVAVLGTLLAIGSFVAEGLGKAWRFMSYEWDTRVVPAARRIWNVIQEVWKAIQIGIKDVMPAIQDAWKSFGIELGKQGGFWDDATTAFGNFSKDLVKFVKSDTFASIIATMAVSIPAAIKIAADSTMLWLDTLQMVFTVLATGVRMIIAQSHGDYGEAKRIAEEGFGEVQKIAGRYKDHMGTLAEDVKKQFDGTNKAMWQQAHDDIMVSTGQIGEDGAPRMAKAMTKIHKQTQAGLQEIKLQASIDGVQAGANIADGMAKGAAGRQAAVDAAMVGLARGAQRALQRSLQSGSPSEVFAKMGESIPQGAALGVERGTFELDTAILRMTGAGSMTQSTPAASLPNSSSSMLSVLQQIRDGMALVARNTDPTNQPMTVGAPSSPSVPGGKATNSTMETLAYKMLADAQNKRNQGIRGESY